MCVPSSVTDASRVIRLAVAADAPALAELAERTFRETFAADNSPENMQAHCRSSYGASLQSAEILDPKRVTLVAEECGALIGFLQLRWGDTPGCIAGRAPGEIQRLYVAHEAHGSGLARALMDRALDILRDRGSDVAWLGVWEKNARAIAFYRKSGFTEQGSHVFAVGSDPQRDILMARPLAGG